MEQFEILQEEFYTKWMQIWMLSTALPKEKQGLVVFLSVPQNICECIRHLSIDDISRADGLKSTTDKWDEIYLQDWNTSAYMAFKYFYSYRSYWCK